MIIQDIDKGKPFDWGKTSKDYAKYRDFYPKEFYEYILNLGLCKDGQNVLDLGTVLMSPQPNQLAAWDREHKEMLEKNTPENFMIKHYVSITELQVTK